VIVIDPFLAGIHRSRSPWFGYLVRLALNPDAKPILGEVLQRTTGIAVSR
jgi:hypothetical protein